MSPGSGLAELALPALAFTLVHSLWQTALLALGYGAWKALVRPSVSLRYRAALLALGLGAVAAGATCWTLVSTRESSPVAGSVVLGATASSGVAQLTPAPLAAPIPTAWLSALSSTAILRGLVVVWMAGAVVLAVRLLGGVLLAGRIRKRAAPLPHGDLHEANGRLAIRLGLRKPVELLQSGEVDVPVALGWRRPAVLFPVDLVGDAAHVSLEPLLAHELAHVRTQDYAMNVAQTAFEALFFFCPGSWWLSAEVRRLREYRCDDVALALCGAPARYARALAGLAERACPGFPAPAAVGPRLVDRIRRLAEGDPMPRSRPTYVVTLGTAAAVTALLGFSLFSATRLHAARPARPQEAFTPWTCPAPPPLRLPPSGLFPGHELAPQDTEGRYFYCDPALIDGQPVEWQRFTTGTRGTLTLVHGDPRSAAATRIPFSLSLRRGGKILRDPKVALLNRPVVEADLGAVLAIARAGDQLIIDPVDKSDWRAKRIVELGGC